MGRSDRGKQRSKKTRTRSHEIRDALAENAMLQILGRWARIEEDGTETDGSDADLERGPAVERMIAGDRVCTFIDKVFGGLAVEVIREQEDTILHYPLGRVSDRETPGSVLGHDLFGVEGSELPPPATAVVSGVWRNDRNGFVREQVTGLTEDAVIDLLVRAFQREYGSPPVDTDGRTNEQAVNKVARHTGDSMARQRKSKVTKKAFTAVLFQGDLVGEDVVHVTDLLTSRFGLKVLAVSSADTDGGGGGGAVAPEAYGGRDGEEVAQLAAYSVYQMSNRDVPDVKTEAGLDAWASRRARALRKLVDGLEKDIVSRKRTALWNRVERIRHAAEQLLFGINNWELEDEDNRWQAEHAKKRGG